MQWFVSVADPIGREEELGTIFTFLAAVERGWRRRGS
jgi:hypothetical protein